MFIAVRPIFQKSENIIDKVLILDTKDLSLEYVSVNDLRSIVTYDGVVPCIGNEKIYGLMLGLKVYTSVVDALTFMLPCVGLKRTEDDGTTTESSGIVSRESDNVWRFGDYIYRHNDIFSFYDDYIRYSICISNKTVYTFKSIDEYNVHYVFRFKEYLIIRLTYLLDTPYFTVVLNKDSEIVSLYSSEEFIYGDSMLYSKIETLCQY